MRILSIIGARPQFIKHAIMQKALIENGIEEILVHTGQHFDATMSDVFFQSLQMRKPDYYLGKKSLEGMLKELKKIEAKFDCVLVYGDTTSTLAGALYAKEVNKFLIHIEAGLRSYDMQMPEERNRVLTDRLSDLLFVPTKQALDNLNKEGFGGKGFGRVVLSGDIMQDSFEYFIHFALPPKGLDEEQEFILCTLHRQSNVDCKERLEFLIDGLNAISQEQKIIFPLHPRVAKRLREFEIELSNQIVVLPPQGYLQTLWLLKNAQKVLTDSGGLQKEAFFAKKQALILRDVSEWVELAECGACELLGQREVYKAYKEMGEFGGVKRDLSIDLYGGGKSVEKIVETLKALKF